MSNEQAALEREFIDICWALFAKEGFTARQVQPSLQGAQPDLVVADGSGKITYVEIKFYRSIKGVEQLAQNGLAQLERIIKQQGEGRGILVLSTPVAGIRLQDVDVSIDIWDIDTLFKKCRPDQSLIRRLAAWVRAVRVGAAESLPSGEFEQEIAAVRVRGSQVARDLEACPAGRPGADQFEATCERAIRLLFESEFGALTKQHPVEDGFHRLDLIGRLAPKHEFWVSLARDFRTRYVVFEFKNYSNSITQDQIYTTERYLYPAALRSVAVVVARNGVSDSATSAIKGALRESGKLVLHISAVELAAMLRGFDDGDDPHNLLIDRMDAILTDIGR